MKITLFTYYVENVFKELSEIFNDTIKSRNIKEEFNNNPFLHFLVIFHKDKIIGFLEYNLMYDKIEINNINIDLNFRNKGCASKLIEKLLEFSLKKDVYNITLEVNKDNFKAINLYKKFGFIDKTIRKGYYNGVDGILMERKMK